MRHEPRDPHPQNIGPYRVESLIGVGGMGQVYKAYDERLDRRVALKQVSTQAVGYPRVRERFRREARAAARLNHPSIVQIYDVLEEEGYDWIVMELVEGRTMARILSSGPLDPIRAVVAAREVTEGLAAAHAEGIVHRDLKSENVMLTFGGRSKILDFGLAKQLWRSEVDVSLSLEGNLLGTVRSMSPEQPLGKKIDHRSDLFSFGTLLYEMLTGRSPFVGPTAVETAIRVCSHLQTSVRQHNPSISQELSDLVDQLLEKEPERRPDSALEVSAALARIAHSLSSEDARAVLRSASGSGSQPSPHFASGLEAGPEGALVRHPAPRGLLSARGSLAERGVQRRERRQITLMCCDLVNADEAEKPLDPEALYDVMREVQLLVGENIRPFEGHVGNVLDHRLLVYFGYPHALADDARRAVHAALAVSEQLARRDRRSSVLAARRMAMRIGIHTGPAVIVTEEGAGERVILGETLNLAAGVKNLAAPGAVTVSGDTQRLIEGFFTLGELQPARLAGFADALEVYQVLAARDIHSRVDAGTRLTPLVARDRELELLLDRWHLAKEGAGQVVWLSGEPGIGKSRLVRTLEERLADEPRHWLRAFGSSYTRTSPLFPVIKLLHRLLRFEAQDTPRQQLAKLDSFLERLQVPLGDLQPTLAALLSLRLEEGGRLLENGNGEEQRRKTLEAVLALLLELAEHQPLFLVVEDLQWVDPSTLDLLGRLIQRSTAAPIFTLLTSQSGFEVPWGQPSNLTQLALSRLSAQQVEVLIDRAAGGKALPREVREQIVAKTDGVPLFVEELTKSVIESGLLLDRGLFYELAGPLPPLAIPATLQASLMSRLDRLGTAKEVAQVAAALGREFSYDLLATVWTLEESVLQRELDRLLGAELLHRRGFKPRVKYSFKHALIQDTAYGTLLKKERQQLHRRIAEVLDGWTSETSEIQPEQLAYHHTEAGNHAAAIGYWLQAGRQAIERSAHLEAIAHLEKGLELLQSLPDSPERGLQELSLLTTLGPALSNLKGFEDPELEHIYTRAGELCLRLGNEPEHFWVLRSISAYFITRARPCTTLRLVQRLLQLAESEHDAKLLLEGHYAVGLTHFLLGELAPARAHLEMGIGFDEAARDRSNLARTGEDAGVACLSILALVLWHQGHLEAAVERSREALARAREIGHPGTLAEALALAAWLHHLRRDPAAAGPVAEEAIAIAEEQGSLLWLTHGELLLGWSQTATAGSGAGAGVGAGAGEAASVDAVAESGRLYLSLEAYRIAGVLFAQTFLLSLLAEITARDRQVEQDFRLLQEALAAVQTSGERFWEAELHRRCGELLLTGELAAGGDGEQRRREAEGHFQQALEAARRQQAKSLELRAAVSLGRLWAEEPAKHQEAHTLLAASCNLFAARLDSPDLHDARTLLSQLGPSA